MTAAQAVHFKEGIQTDMKKWYNGLFSVKQWLDEDKEDYDFYDLGCQVESEDKETAKQMMFEEIAKFGRLETEYGIKAKFEGFCSEDEFDIVGCDVI